MATATIESFADQLGAALGARLVSLLLYGSAARGAHVPQRSDLNTLLVCDAVDEELFTRIARVVRRWVAAGNPAPLILTEREWRGSADAFPIEYEDMREAHRVLAGRDPWAGITVERGDVRRQLEQELMGKLVRLRQAYAGLHGDRKALARVIVGTAPGFFTMLRAALRLSGAKPSSDPAELVRAAGAAMGWPAEGLAPLVGHVAGRGSLRLGAGDALPAAYLAAVARTAEFVNRLA